MAQSTQPIFDRLQEYNQAHAKPIKPLTYEETRFYVGLHLSIFNQRSFATSPTYLINTNATSRYPTLHGLTLGYETLPRTYLETGIAFMDYQSAFAFTRVLDECSLPLGVSCGALNIGFSISFRKFVLASRLSGGLRVWKPARS